MNIDNKSTFTPQKFKELTKPPEIETDNIKRKKSLTGESTIRRLKTAKLGEGIDNSEDEDSENHEIQTKKTEKSQQILDPTPQKTTVELEEGNRNTEQNILQ